MNNKPNVIFSVSGGIGKNIVGTSVVQSIKVKYPEHDLVVVSPYPEVFLNNPNVHRIFKSGVTPYFMEDYIKEDTVVLMSDPYQHGSFVHKNKHLSEVWCDTFNIEHISTNTELFLTKSEIQFAREKFTRQKPIFVIQTNGGTAGGKWSYSWARDIPNNQAQQIVNIMTETHYVFHIRRQDQPALNNCEAVHADFRELFGLISISDKRLFNESFGYHAAAAFNLPSTVCFIGTKPEVYSYPIHDNIKPKDEKTFIHGIDKYMEDSPWGGEKLYECPYNINNLFSVTEIVESIQNQKHI